MTIDEDEEVQIRAAFYVRVSTEEQVDKYGPQMQREAVEAIVASRGKLKDGRPRMVLAGPQYIYEDLGHSGTLAKEEREGMARLIKDLERSTPETRPFDCVVVYRIDRLARNLWILLDIVNTFKKHGVTFISSRESIDTNTAFGRAMLGIMGVIAELEWETITDRTKTGQENYAKAGKFRGKSAPFGYDKDKEDYLIKFEPEAKFVERIFREFTIEKQSCHQIAVGLRKDKVMTSVASSIFHKKFIQKKEAKTAHEPFMWQDGMVMDILKNEVYTGRNYYNKTHKEVSPKTKKARSKRLPQSDWMLAEHMHEPLVSPGVFRLTQEIIARRSGHYKKTLAKLTSGKDEFYLLSSLIKCDHCKQELEHGKYLYTKWAGLKDLVDEKSGKVSYKYQCNRKNGYKAAGLPKCYAIPIPAKPLENFVANFITALIQNPQKVIEYQTMLDSTKLSIKSIKERLEALRKLYNGLPTIKENIKKLFTNSLITEDELRLKMAEADLSEAEYKQAINEKEEELAGFENRAGYEEVFTKLKDRYMHNFSELVKDKIKLSEIIHMLISEIVIFSRPATAKDTTAGRKPSHQQYIPNSIQIKLRLPQALLVELVEQGRFTVNNGNVWVTMDSNHGPLSYQDSALTT